MTQTCPALTLSAEEQQRLEDLPDAEYPAPDKLYCELDRDHTGRHAAFAQEYATHEGSRTFVQAWAWWDEQGHQVLEGGTCGECEQREFTRPAGHEGIHGPTPTCRSKVLLTRDEVEFINVLPEGVHETESENYCDLEPGHEGEHSCLLTSQEKDGETIADWWVTWTEWNGNNYVVATAEPCPVKTEFRGRESECLYRIGHGGEHW